VVNPGRPDGRLYAAFIPLSSPSRREGMSAENFITPQYLSRSNNLLEQIYGERLFHSKLFNNYFEIIENIQIFVVNGEIILKLL
jgi:hypothetical protein